MRNKNQIEREPYDPRRRTFFLSFSFAYTTNTYARQFVTTVITIVGKKKTVMAAITDILFNILIAAYKCTMTGDALVRMFCG